MTHVRETTLSGHAGDLYGRIWSDPAVTPQWVALICHGYGEHVGRYDWFCEQLVAAGAVCYALDHVGHGRSDGERVLIDDFEPVVADFHELLAAATREHPHLPVVLIGHSMGGLIATRFAQTHGDELAAVVLSGPVLGRWATVEQQLAADEIPDDPIDTSTLSRDPEVGKAYTADELVWHGPFKRPTLEALQRELERAGQGGRIDRPLLWLHGEADALVPYEGSAQGWPAIRGRRSRAQTYPQARHEIFNEINKDEVTADVVAFVRDSLTPADDPA